MMLPKLRHIGPAKILAAGIVGLAAFGVGITARATCVVANGGDTTFDGKFHYPAWSTVHFVPAMVFMLILPFQLWSGSRGHFRVSTLRRPRCRGRWCALVSDRVRFAVRHARAAIQ
jgi:hypothetical protein